MAGGREETSRRIAHNLNAVIRRPAFLVGLLAFLALTGSSGTAGAPSATTAGTPSAEAFGISVSAPGIGSASAGGVSAPPNASTSGSLAFPGDGSIARAASVSSSVTGSAGSTTAATASVQVSGLSFFNGEITVGSVTARAAVRSTGRSASGHTSGSAVTGLVVMGQPVAGTPGTSVAYGTWGSVSVLQQSSSPYGSGGSKGYQARVTALVVHLNAEHGGAPAGTDIVVGYADLAAEMSAPQKPVPTTPEQEVKPRPKPKQEKEPKTKDRSGQPPGPPPVRAIPYGVLPKLTAGRYVFPVYGQASYGNTFGAPRANTGWHHGEDIFAPLGAPILAVADGIVYSVGWNDVGGLRLWLQDQAGNEFYYAHLSAYSPLAVNGAQVRAGEVLGFMGNTGDAEHTPYHLHFEIHPASMLYLGYDGAVAPYPYLNAWKRLVDLSLTAVSGWAPPISDSSRAPRPGAILLQSRDISTATGLDPGSLRRAMRAVPESQADGSLQGLAARGREAPRGLTRAARGPS
jgi:murein DD-endopeptidase MepM/ murein hydrolase activator NlpD